MSFKPRDMKEGPTQSRLRDDTMIEGKLLESPMVLPLRGRRGLPLPRHEGEGEGH
ncbi:MAG: hypothetical protein QM755_10560 [Luteolibacter sp.]